MPAFTKYRRTVAHCPPHCAVVCGTIRTLIL